MVDGRCVALLFCAVGCYSLSCVCGVRGCCCWPASLLVVSCGCVVRLCWLLGVGVVVSCRWSLVRVRCLFCCDCELAVFVVVVWRRLVSFVVLVCCCLVGVDGPCWLWVVLVCCLLVLMTRVVVC